MQLFNRDDNPFQKNVSFQSDDIDYMALILIVFLTIVIILSTKAFDEGNTCERLKCSFPPLYTLTLSVTLLISVIQVLHVGLVVLTFVIAFTKARKSYWTPFFPKTCSADGLSCPDDGSLLPKEDSCVDSSFGPRGARRIITGASNLFFVFIGYDVIALGAEEVMFCPQSLFPHHGSPKFPLSPPALSLYLSFNVWSGCYQFLKFQAKSPYSVPIGMLGAVALVTIIYVWANGIPLTLRFGLYPYLFFLYVQADGLQSCYALPICWLGLSARECADCCLCLRLWAEGPQVGQVHCGCRGSHRSVYLHWHFPLWTF